MAEGQSPAVPRVPHPRCRGGPGLGVAPLRAGRAPLPPCLPQVLALTGVTLPAALLSLLGSGSVLAVTSWQGRCCHIQLRPLFLLALADFLAATALLGTGTIPLLPAPLSVPAYAACPYGRMLTTTSYAVSFLMVVVYAFESHRAVLGGRARPPAVLQERSRCLERAWQAIPYILAWLVPALTLLAQLIARGTSVADIAPVVPWDGRGSNDTFSLYCSSCLLLIHPNQDICSQSGGGKNAGLEEKIIFLLYLLVVLGCCSLLYRRVRLRCRGNAALPLLSLDRDGGFGGRSGRSISKASLYFQLVFLLCWTPAFFLTILSFTSISPASLFVLYMSTALSVSLQGFLHCLVYAWMRENFRREVLARSPALQSPGGIQAFYDDSLEAAP
ncbi:transmembrane protein 116-like [Cyanocitta cristata]